MDRPVIQILNYELQSPRCESWDRRVVVAADAIVQFLKNELPSAQVEHIGSTAVADCAGKGIIDVMVAYPPGELAPTRGRIDQLGFQPQTSPDRFPEERPMRTGAFDFAGQRYLLHVHVVSKGDAEVEDARYFRDCLRADAELRKAYVAFKKKILATGVCDPTEYAIAKGEFVRQCLGH